MQAENGSSHILHMHEVQKILSMHKPGLRRHRWKINTCRGRQEDDVKDHLHMYEDVTTVGVRASEQVITVLVHTNTPLRMS